MMREHGENGAACVACGAAPAPKAGENTVFGGTRDICFCEKCGLYFLAEPPADEELQAYYAREYYTALESSPLAYALRSRFARMRAWSQFLYIRRILGKRAGRVLEIGSNDGSLLAVFKKRGWDVTGLEFSEFSIRKAWEVHRIRLESRDFLSLTPEGGRFDVIMFSHVLEHMTDPLGVLDHCKTLLNPRGAVFIELPQSPLAGECTPDQLQAYLNTTHLYDFREESLARLVEKSGIPIAGIDRFFYHIPPGLGKFSRAIGDALMTGRPPLGEPLDLCAVLGTAMNMQARCMMGLDPMTPVRKGAPWTGLGDVIRLVART